MYSCTLQSFVFSIVLNMFYSPLIVIDDSKENVLSYTYCDSIMWHVLPELFRPIRRYIQCIFGIIQCESKNSTPCSFPKIFPKLLRIFNHNFICLLHVHIHACNRRVKFSLKILSCSGKEFKKTAGGKIFLLTLYEFDMSIWQIVEQCLQLVVKCSSCYKWLWICVNYVRVKTVATVGFTRNGSWLAHDSTSVSDRCLEDASPSEAVAAINAICCLLCYFR